MEVESTTPQITLGEFLQKAREKRGFSVEYVADHLKLKISTVKALEANDYHGTGGLVYVRGYLRSYARLLNVNIDQALEHITDENETLVQKPERPVSATKTPRASSDKFGLWASVIIIILLLVAVYLWHHHHAKMLAEESEIPAALVETPNTTHAAETAAVPEQKPAEVILPIIKKDEPTPAPDVVSVPKAPDLDTLPKMKAMAPMPEAKPEEKEEHAAPSSEKNDDEAPSNNTSE